jgi:hypothetical protein
VEGALPDWGASIVEGLIAIRVAEKIHSTELHYCGGLSRSELTVCSWSKIQWIQKLVCGMHLLVLGLYINSDRVPIVSGSIIYCT